MVPRLRSGRLRVAPLRGGCSADLECGQGQGGKGGADEPETHDHLRLTPADQMEVVMDRSTSEEAFASGISEVTYLQDHAEQFDDEYAADYQKQDFISCHKRAVAHRRTQRERTHVAHEGLGRMAVKPQETEHGP